MKQTIPHINKINSNGSLSPNQYLKVEHYKVEL